MTVLVGNLTPYIIWRVNGSLVGACRTEEQAIGTAQDLKRSFPDSEYQVKGPDGDVFYDTQKVDAS